MSKLIRHHDNANQPIVDVSDDTLDLIYFNVVTLAAGQSHSFQLPGHEAGIVVLEGQVDICVDGQDFNGVGQRKDIWSGSADAVYVPLDTPARITARGHAVCAIAGGVATEKLAAFRITPQDVEMVDVGSVETHTHRQIFHILGQRQNGQVSRLLISELYADPGCWSGYPPHKHDTADGTVETDHEELYYYRFDPETGFGTQCVYNDGEEPQNLLTQNGDTFLLDRGYHPTSTSPGHRGYIFTILVGRHQRGLIQRFEPKHVHLVDAIPGIQAMRDAFK
ncbi:5-deoxy-glucuronate isomerase [Devosia sp.]|uniref:5-deoxy-glucuronate isomerase n=1 Tax=Devosia sp. TaxID=1871048 RepID=UPI001AC5C165|nr:5-deoxy-glucuronate isomerase [Devosia sp.]MBN9332468.1 5-deoxy-glucuronate isomerase [Devosia sp.]